MKVIGNSLSEEIEVWNILEISISINDYPFLNPFKDVQVVGKFLSPSGERFKIEGFYDGGSIWKLRFTPGEIGKWYYHITLFDNVSIKEGELYVIPSNKEGFLTIDRTNSYKFSFSNGESAIPIGDTCYNLFCLDLDTQIIPYINLRLRQGFNFVRASLSPYRITEQSWPWLGTFKNPDLDHFNLDFFKYVDTVIEYFYSCSMGLELILENFYSGPMKDLKLWTQEREKMWLRYIIARYSAFTNIFWWTITNEFEVYPDGIYRFDYPEDLRWVDCIASFIKRIDPFKHLITVHPEAREISTIGSKTTYNFGYNPNIDFIMTQIHGECRKGIDGCYHGTGIGIEQKVLSERRYSKPVVVGEFGYEFNGYTTGGVNVDTDLLRRHAWRTIMAGGYYVAGFRSTVWNFDDVIWDIENNGQKGQWQLSYLNTFITEKIEYRQLEPKFDLVNFPNLCRANIGSEYVVYSPFGDMIEIQLSEGNYTIEWLDTIRGTYYEKGNVKVEDICEYYRFEPPHSGEWILHLKAISK